MTESLIQKLKTCMSWPATTDKERETNHVLSEAIDFIRSHEQAIPEAESALNDWTIIEENGKKYVKVELDAMVAYREKMEGMRGEIPDQMRVEHALGRLAQIKGEAESAIGALIDIRERELSAEQLLNRLRSYVRCIAMGKEDAQLGASAYNWGKRYIYIIESLLVKHNIAEDGA